MTSKNQRVLFMIAFTSLMAGGWFLETSSTPIPPFQREKTTKTPEAQKSFKSNYGPSGTVTITPEKNVRKPASVPPAPVWKTNLEKSLLSQANGLLKSSEITKVDSFSWKMGKVDVPVESLLVKLVHNNGQTTTFRAMVDSTNGKILETWDLPQDENYAGHHEGIHVDSRYHND